MLRCKYTCGDPENSVVGVPKTFFSHNIFHRGRYGPPRESIGPDGSNYFSRGSVPVCLFVCFVALRPKSTDNVMSGLSVHLITLFLLDKLEQAVDQYFMHIRSLVTDNNPS